MMCSVLLLSGYYLRELPVIGFNSGRYDLNLIKKYITPYLLTSNVDEKDIENDNKLKDANGETDMLQILCLLCCTTLISCD